MQDTEVTAAPMVGFWDVMDNLRLDEAVGPNSEYFIETDQARGDDYWNRLLRSLGVRPDQLSLGKAVDNHYGLLAGHIGCGKSSELERLRTVLSENDLYFVVFADSYTELDPNDLRYTDLLLHLAGRLCTDLNEAGVVIDDVHLGRLTRWFTERVETEVDVTSYTADVRAGAEARVGLPLLAGLFTKLSAAISTGVSNKTEIRTVIQNSFQEFAEAFSALITAAEEALAADPAKPDKIMFIVDGTDRLSAEDTTRLFSGDIHQLKQVRGNFLYTVRIDTIYENKRLEGLFDVMTIPMIKIVERDGTPIPAAIDTLKDMILRRVPLALFDDESTVEYLAEMSGGHPRDLLRLLRYAQQHAKEERFDRAAAEEAVKVLATDYRRILTAEDFALLAQIDMEDDTPQSPETKRLLHNAALLEYNAYFWKSHPVIRTLAGYQNARNTG